MVTAEGILATACIDGTVLLWSIPSLELQQMYHTPNMVSPPPPLGPVLFNTTLNFVFAEVLECVSSREEAHGSRIRQRMCACV